MICQEFARCYLSNLLSDTSRYLAEDWRLSDFVFVYVFVFVFVFVFLLKYYVFKILSVAQQETGDKEDNQDLLSWESLALLL